jgi:DNA-binding transcriptional MerR regulator
MREINGVTTNGIPVYSLDEAATALDIQYYHIIYNERVGKFPPSRRDDKHRRIYTKPDLKELRAIIDGKSRYDHATNQVVPI